MMRLAVSACVGIPNRRRCSRGADPRLPFRLSMKRLGSRRICRGTMPAWSQSVETRGGGAWWAHTFRPHPAAEPLTWGRAQEALADGSLGPHLHALLASSPHRAYFCETPPLSRHATDQPFEFVSINAPHLETDADTHSFAELLCRGPSS